MTAFGLWVYNGGWWILLTVGVLLAMAAVMTGLVFNTKGLGDELSGRTRRREVERLKRKYAGMRDEDIEGRMRELVEPLETASDGAVASVPSPVSGAASAPVYGAVTPFDGASAVAADAAAGRGSVVAELKASIYGYDEEDEEEKTGVFTPETSEEGNTPAVKPYEGSVDTLAVEPEEDVVSIAAVEPVAQSVQFDAQGVELPQRPEELQQSKEGANPAKKLEELPLSTSDALQTSNPAKKLEELPLSTSDALQTPNPGIPPILPVTLEHEDEAETSVDLSTVEDTEAETSVDLSTVEDTEAETSVDLSTVEDTEAETSVDLTTVGDTEAETSVDLTEDPKSAQGNEALDEYPTEVFELPRIYLPDMPISASALRLNTAGLGILAEEHSTGSYDPVTGETKKHNTVEGETGTSFVSQL